MPAHHTSQTKTNNRCERPGTHTRKCKYKPLTKCYITHHNIQYFLFNFLYISRVVNLSCTFVFAMRTCINLLRKKKNKLVGEMYNSQKSKHSTHNFYILFEYTHEQEKKVKRAFFCMRAMHKCILTFIIQKANACICENETCSMIISCTNKE